MGLKLFSKWAKWLNREKLDYLEFPGIYAIAYSVGKLENKPFKWIKEIQYIGMTNSKKGLKGRLDQFDNTIKGKKGHGGASRFKYKYIDKCKYSYKELADKLFVSVSVFKCGVNSNKPKDLTIMGEVSKSEYLCLAEYVKKYRVLPEFNDKERSPKK